MNLLFENKIRYKSKLSTRPDKLVKEKDKTRRISEIIIIKK